MAERVYTMAKIFMNDVKQAVENVLAPMNVVDVLITIEDKNITVGDVLDWFDKETGKAVRRNARTRARNAEKRNNVNAPIADAIKAALADAAEPMTAKDLVDTMGLDITGNKVASVVKTMLADVVTTTKVKGKNVYALITNEDVSEDNEAEDSE